MKYVITFLWSFLLVTMLNYVAGSIAGVASFDFMGGVIAAVVLAVVVLAITAIIPDEEVADY
jgi:tryptophan-rich sensory protein